MIISVWFKEPMREVTPSFELLLCHIFTPKNKSSNRKRLQRLPTSFFLLGHYFSLAKENLLLLLCSMNIEFCPEEQSQERDNLKDDIDFISPHVVARRTQRWRRQRPAREGTTSLNPRTGVYKRFLSFFWCSDDARFYFFSDLTFFTRRCRGSRLAWRTRQSRRWGRARRRSRRSWTSARPPSGRSPAGGSTYPSGSTACGFPRNKK